MTLFQPADLQRHIDQALGDVPVDRRGAFVGYWTIDGSFRVVMATKVGDHWQIGGFFERECAEGKVNLNAGVIVRGTW